MYRAVDSVRKTLMDLGIMKLKPAPAVPEEETGATQEESVEKPELAEVKQDLGKEEESKPEEESVGKDSDIERIG